ncbi:LuxR family transcriptional regulator [Sphingopyxis sp.]|uniref:helix-turn-helix transcriptional regulator n=1 Tax=Sphingopyxis sp. TaxID=1908224 RepID=UPI0025E5AE8C|nr:LuxR family transcriptional regulator [Sphingopyxis sp.]MBK6413879.1 autoinducer binding domain-containing protein [Sphingopyxis sp.]
MNRYHLLEELSAELSSATSQENLFAALADASARLGFSHFALAYERRGGGTTGSLLIHDYPATWARTYVDLDLGGADPVRRAGERSMTGFEWRNLAAYVPLTKRDLQMLEMGRQNGLAEGFTVPRHLPGEASGACSFVMTTGNLPDPATLSVAEILGAVALTSARQIVGGTSPRKRPTLSERQRECVLWTARGKTASEVGAILGISEETVIQHLKIARDRYDVHCRQMLILCTLFDGLIGFSDIYDWWQA